MNLSWKKGVALGLAAFMTASMMPTGIVKVDAAAKNAVTAKSTTVKVAANNVITLNKAAKNYKVTVAVTGKAKSGVTVKYGKSVLVKNGKTQKAGKNQVLAQKTSIKLTATAAKSVVNKKYQVKVTYYNAKGKKVATKTTNEVTVAPIPVSSVTLNKKTATVNVGKTVTLKATVKPNNATNKTVTWTSSNKKIATVTNKGVVKGIKAGTATITAKSGTKKATCKITVKANTVAVTGVALNPTELNLTVGNSGKLTATVSPANATNKTVTWKSSDTNVATVSGGTVKAVGKGEANITATAGGKTATAKVTVVSGETAVQSVVLSKKAPIEGDVLETTITPADATNPTYVWYTSNTADGELTPIEGQTASTLAVDSSMIGKFITVVVNAGDDSTAKDVTTSAVVADPKVTVDHAELDNTTPKVGATITAEAINSDDEVLEGDVTYQWYRVATAGSGATGQATPITGANKASYTVQSADLGFTLYCCVIDKYGNEVETEATQIIASTTFTATITGMSEKAPGSEIENVPVVGDTLKVELSDAGVDEAVEYQWYRDNAKINGATEPEYTVVDNDYTFSMKCVVTVKDSYKAGYTLKEQPAATKIVGKSIANAEVVINPKGANVGTVMNFYVPFDVNKDGEIKAADHDYLTLQSGSNAMEQTIAEGLPLNKVPDASITLYRDEVKNTNRIPAADVKQGKASGNLLDNQYVTYTPDKADAGHTIIAVVDGLYVADPTVAGVPVDYAIGRTTSTSDTVVQALKEAVLKVDGKTAVSRNPEEGEAKIQYVGQKLSVDVTDMLNGTVTEDNLSYVWKRAGLVIGTGSTYTLTEDDITQNPVVYSVEVSAANTAYTGVVTDSETAATVAKKAPVTITIFDKTQGRKVAEGGTSYGSPSKGDELEIQTKPAAAISDFKGTWTTIGGVELATGMTYTVGDIDTPITATIALKDQANVNWTTTGGSADLEEQTVAVSKPLTGIAFKFKKVKIADGKAVLDANKDEQYAENAEVGTLLEVTTTPKLSYNNMEYRLYVDEVKADNLIDNTTWDVPAAAITDKNSDGVADNDDQFVKNVLPTTAIPDDYYGHSIVVVATAGGTGDGAYGSGDYDGAFTVGKFDVVGSTRTLTGVDVEQGTNLKTSEKVTTLKTGTSTFLNKYKTSDGETFEFNKNTANSDVNDKTVKFYDTMFETGTGFKWVDTTDNKQINNATYTSALDGTPMLSTPGSLSDTAITAGHHYKLTITPDGINFTGDPLVVEFDADAESAVKVGLVGTKNGDTTSYGVNAISGNTYTFETVVGGTTKLNFTVDGVPVDSITSVTTTTGTAMVDTIDPKTVNISTSEAGQVTVKAIKDSIAYTFIVPVPSTI